MSKIVCIGIVILIRLVHVKTGLEKKQEPRFTRLLNVSSVAPTGFEPSFDDRRGPCDAVARDQRGRRGFRCDDADHVLTAFRRDRTLAGVRPRSSPRASFASGIVFSLERWKHSAARRIGIEHASVRPQGPGNPQGPPGPPPIGRPAPTGNPSRPNLPTPGPGNPTGPGPGGQPPFGPPGPPGR